MHVRLISVPYDSGHRGFRMGLGPDALLTWGLADRIASAGHDVSTVVIDGPDSPTDEVSTGFALCANVAHEVRSVVGGSGFPIVLTGNCLMQVGVVGGITPKITGVVWFDAHGDLNTPETTASGFLDGMALSVVVGWCLESLAGRVDGFTPIGVERIALVGARALDEPEREAIGRESMLHIPPSQMKHADWVQRVLATMAPCDAVSVHLDLDVLDPNVCPVNALQAPCGMSIEQAMQMVDALAAQGRIAALTLSAYDPAVDPQHRTPPVAERLVHAALATG